MEYLATVRDGSEDGQLVNGYWTTQVIAAKLGKNQVLPLYQELYSQKAPEFRSENEQVIKAMDMVGQSCHNRGIWVIDRGAIGMYCMSICSKQTLPAGLSSDWWAPVTLSIITGQRNHYTIVTHSNDW